MCRSFSVIFFIYAFFCAFRDALYSYGHSVRFELLPPANEVWGKVIFLHLPVILFTGRVSLSACWDSRPPRSRSPWADTPRDQTHPLGPDTTQGADGLPGQCMLGDTANTLAVRILQECILVHIIFGLNYITSCAIQMHLSNKRIGPIVSSNLVFFSK